EVVTQVCPDLVDMIEGGAVDSPELDPILRSYLGPLLSRGIDTLVLGCTHYSFLRADVEKIVGPQVAVLETSLPVAKQAERVVKEYGMAKDRDGLGSLSFFTSGNREEFLSVVDKLLAGKALI
ncbi:MAG: Glutamate racemase, partial [Dehalococcoidia bacterium]|nr:Glutamate racemase [Dehalococcoidia bacterium]